MGQIAILYLLLFLQFDNNLGNEKGEKEKDRVCRKGKSLPIFHREAGKLKDTGRGDWYTVDKNQSLGPSRAKYTLHSGLYPTTSLMF